MPAADSEDAFVFLGESDCLRPVGRFAADDDDPLDSRFTGDLDLSIGAFEVLGVVDVAMGVDEHELEVGSFRLEVKRSGDFSLAPLGVQAGRQRSRWRFDYPNPRTWSGNISARRCHAE